MEYSLYKFLNNPFRIVPAIDPKEIIWAGMKTLQKQIDFRVEQSINTSPSRILLNWGRYGSGKTHAANFYTKTNYIKDKFRFDTKNIKVNLPRSSKEPIQAFLRSLIGQMNFDNILLDFQEFGEFYGNRAGAIIESYTQDQIISQFLKLFLDDSEKQKVLFPELNVSSKKYYCAILFMVIHPKQYLGN